MRVRAVTIAFLMLAGCGDDTVPGNPDGGGIDAPRTGDGPSPGACDPVAQTCAAAERCTLDHSMPISMTFCESMMGTAGEFQGCTPTQSSDNCVRGTVCLNTGDQRTCRKFCNTDMDCGNNVCAINIGGTSGPLHACAQKCSVLTQDCTTSGESCYLGLNVTGQATQQCSNTGTKTPGMPCMVANDCVRGSLCISTTGSDAGAGLFCREACDLSNAQCPGGTTCTAAGTGQGNLGFCRVP